MLRLAADENLNNAIVRGIVRRNPAIDIVRVQDVDLSGADDPSVPEWAAHDGRVLFTHDITTMTRYADERVRRGQPMPGLFEVGRDVPIGSAIEDIVLVAEYSRNENGKARSAICRCVDPEVSRRRKHLSPVSPATPAVWKGRMAWSQSTHAWSKSPFLTPAMKAAISGWVKMRVWALRSVGGSLSSWTPIRPSATLQH